MTKPPFNPFTSDIRRNLKESFEERPLSTLPPNLSENGCGVYAIYYCGDFGLYAPLVVTDHPIYIGKAVPPGGRKGGGRKEITQGPHVIKRLGEHSRTIEAASNLDLTKFTCRWLSVVELFVAPAEVILIDIYKPLWNQVISGFGIHDPGKGRYKQARSDWDMLHPGRTFATKMPNGNTIGSIKKEVLSFYQEKPKIYKVGKWSP